MAIAVLVIVVRSAIFVFLGTSEFDLRPGRHRADGASI
jgi:hypothetical protein